MKISETNHVLIALGDRQRRDLVADALKEDGHQVAEAGDGVRALELLNRHVFQLVITDLGLPGGKGRSIIESVHESSPVTPVIITTDPDKGEDGLEAMRQGAFDVKELPLNVDHLRMTVNRALEKASLHHAFYYLRHEQPYLYRLESIVADSPGMSAVLKQVAQLAPTSSTVLISGETGVGKNLIAGAIHANSPRREATIVTVSCAALTETLLESELFGHEKGAFTGAYKARTGRFQQAHGGTLFLDEIGEMSSAIQAKVLRALDDQLIYRLGGSREIHVNVRIIAATNRDLAREVEQGGFRRDLFYRLNVAPIHIPPLRQRIEDILPLAQRFAFEICSRLSRPVLQFSESARDALLSHSWPGNVRELRNILERTALFVHQPLVEANDLALHQQPEGPRAQFAAPAPAPAEPQLAPTPQLSPPPPAPASGDSPLFSSDTLDLEELERQAILVALEKSDWVQREAAKLLGLTSSRMSYKLNRLGITHPKFRSRRRRGKTS